MSSLELKHMPEQKQHNAPQHCEQIFLNALQSTKQMVQIYLVTGIKMIGVILSSDDFSILISTEFWGTQMLYKHAITTIAAYGEKK